MTEHSAGLVYYRDKDLGMHLQQVLFIAILSLLWGCAKVAIKHHTSILSLIRPRHQQD
jgi:hypothetical protein